jgi:hypothetical protein
LFDVEWELDIPAEDFLVVAEIDLGAKGLAWESEHLRRVYRRATFVLEAPETVSTAELDFQDRLGVEGLAFTRADAEIALDGSATTFDIGPAPIIGASCTAAQAGLTATLFVYMIDDPVSRGLLPDNLAYLDQIQVWTAAQYFQDLAVGDLSTGITNIDTDALANRVVTFPDDDGEIAVVSTPSPADGEYLVRSGDSYETTGVLLAEDGSAASPSIGFIDDDNNGFYRVGSDNWAGVVGGTAVLFFGTAGGGLFTTLVFSASLVSINATVSWQSTVPDFVIINSTASSGAKLTLREGTTNGSSDVTINAPASLSASYDLELFDSQPADGDGVYFAASGKLKSSPFAGCVAIDFETASAYSTASNSGFNWSNGARLGGDNVGIVVPFDGEIVAITVGGKTSPATNTTTEVYKGTCGSAFSATGLSTTITTAQTSNYTTATGSPVSISAGEAVSLKTTAGSGGTGARATVWIRPA